MQGIGSCRIEPNFSMVKGDKHGGWVAVGLNLIIPWLGDKHGGWGGCRIELIHSTTGG